MGKNDAQLQHRTVDALAAEPLVDASHIAVAAAEGEVTLSGYVTSEAQKKAALNVVRRALREIGHRHTVKDDLVVEPVDAVPHVREHGYVTLEEGHDQS